MKTFKRKRKDSVFGGVCNGLSEYTDVDVLIFRFLFVFLFILIPKSILIYSIIWLLTEVE